MITDVLIGSDVFTSMTFIFYSIILETARLLDCPSNSFASVCESKFPLISVDGVFDAARNIFSFTLIAVSKALWANSLLSCIAETTVKNLFVSSEPANFSASIAERRSSDLIFLGFLLYFSQAKL